MPAKGHSSRVSSQFAMELIGLAFSILDRLGCRWLQAKLSAAALLQTCGHRRHCTNRPGTNCTFRYISRRRKRSSALHSRGHPGYLTANYTAFFRTPGWLLLGCLALCASWALRHTTYLPPMLQLARPEFSFRIAGARGASLGNFTNQPKVSTVGFVALGARSRQGEPLSIIFAASAFHPCVYGRFLSLAALYETLDC